MLAAAILLVFEVVAVLALEVELEVLRVVCGGVEGAQPFGKVRMQWIDPGVVLHCLTVANIA